MTRADIIEAAARTWWERGMTSPKDKPTRRRGVRVEVTLTKREARALARARVRELSPAGQLAYPPSIALLTAEMKLMGAVGRGLLDASEG